MDLGPAATADAPIGPMLPEHAWLQPIPDARVPPAGRRSRRSGDAQRHRAPGLCRRGGRIAAHHNFLDTRLFAAFGLPAALA
jgi:hypothetical protein